MSAAKHTPGPLYAIHHGTSCRHEVRKDYGDTSYRLATLDDHEEAESDAQLFAAAPEMLGALLGLLDMWHGGHLQVRPEAAGAWAAAVEAGEQAIAKAQGASS